MIRTLRWLFYVLLIIIVIPKNTVIAAEPMYFYDKYTVMNMYADEAPWELVGTDRIFGTTGNFWDSWNDTGGWISVHKSPYSGGYSSYVLSINENKYNVSGTPKKDEEYYDSYYGGYKFRYNLYVGAVFYKKIGEDIWRYQIKRYVDGWHGYNTYAPNGDEYGVDGRRYYGDIYKKDPNKNTKKDRKILIQANIKAVEGTYPDDGYHTDGYWYMKKGLDGAAVNLDVNIDTLSPDIKKDITPVLDVIVNKQFISVVSGRGYLTGLLTYNDSTKGSYTAYSQSNDYIRVTGTFKTTGVHFTTVTDANGKKAHFLFNVLPDPAQGSASAVTF